MPGKRGVRLIPRRSVSGKFHSIKSLVFSLLDKNQNITKEEVDRIVRKEYPKSNFSKKTKIGGHYSWYLHKWNKKKAEDAGYNIKEAHHDQKESEASNGSNEGKADQAIRTKGMATTAMGHGKRGREDRRVSVHKKERKVALKTKQSVLQRQRNTKGSRQSTKNKK